MFRLTFNVNLGLNIGERLRRLEPPDLSLLTRQNNAAMSDPPPSSPVSAISINDILPTELLIRIFEVFLKSRPNGYLETLSHYSDLADLARVCRKWCTVVATYPTFWSRIDSADPLAERHFVRSKSAPLTIYLGFPWHSTFNRDEARETRLRLLIFQNIHRWMNVNLWVREGVPLVQTTPAPMLRWFRMRSSSEQTIDLFQGYAPVLRGFSLDRVVLLDWKSSFLFNLQSFSLVKIQTGPSVEQVLDIVRGCRQLEELCLRDVNFTPLAQDPYVEPKTPSHRHLGLRKIDFSSLASLPVARILSALDAPACRDIRLDVNPGEYLGLTVYNQYIASPSRIFLPEAKSLVFKLSDYSLRLRAESRESDLHSPLCINIRWNSASDIFLQCIPFILSVPHHSNTEVIISLHSHDTQILSDAEVVEALWHLPAITSLNLEAPVSELEDDDVDGVNLDLLVHALTEPRVIDRNAQWFLPKLERIKILEGVSRGGMLLEMVEARAQAHLAAISEPGSEHAPVAIRSLEISSPNNLDQETFDAIVAVVGEGASWVGPEW
ncbi:hypothetical protein FRB94_003497 [Tulasnella sp. JGI-2019a]|nr:hypothetical protein FRB94_003497 [Tulasnella sp. JGI-2019a]